MAEEIRMQDAGHRDAGGPLLIAVSIKIKAVDEKEMKQDKRASKTPSGGNHRGAVQRCVQCIGVFFFLLLRSVSQITYSYPE